MRRSYRPLFRLPVFRADRDVDDEFRFHLDMRIAELVRAGHTPESARREALRRFGDIAEARQVCREDDEQRMRLHARVQVLDNLRRDLAVAWRGMIRQPAFTCSAVLVLAAGIAMATAAYGVVHAYLVRPLPYPEPDRLVQIIAGPSREPFPNPPSLVPVDWTAAESVFDATVAWDLDGFTLAGNERPEFVDGAWVSPGYFSALGLQPSLGRGFSRDEYVSGSQVAIISDALWSRRFNRNASVLGRAIRAHSTDRPRDNEVVTIVGVMPENAWHVSRFTDVLRPLTTPRIPSIARLKAGMSMPEAERRLNAVVLPQLGAVDSAWRMTLVSVQDEYTYQVRPLLLPLLGAAGFLLLIAGASVAGAQVARTAARRGEIQVRHALGASRGRIVAQLLTESFLLSVLAALLGTLAANALLGAAGKLIGEQLRAGVPGGAEQLALDTTVLAIAVIFGTVIGVSFAVLPALLSSRTSSGAALGGAQKGVARGAGSPNLRRTLIAAQVAFTMMLLVGAGLMARTILAIGSEPLGFEYAPVVKANLLLPLGRYPDVLARRAGVEQVLAALTGTPGVHSAAVASPHPFRGTMPSQAVAAEGAPSVGDAGPRAVQYVVSPGYFDVMQIPVVGGRVFQASDNGESLPVVMIGETLARRLWPSADPIGRRLRIGSDTVWRSVVGITSDTREVVSSATQQSDIFLPYAQQPRIFVSVVARATADPARMVSVLPRSVAKVDDVLALADVEPMSEVVARDGSRHRTLAGVLAVFGVLALGLAALGLYSSLAYVVEQRRREIAIRVAIGSNAWKVAGLVLSEGVPMVFGGLVAGTVLSLGLTRVLQTQLYGVSPTDTPTFLGIAIIITVSALGAVALPIRQALGVAPAAVLRAD